MSAESLPITPARFAAALTELPIFSLHAKIAELKNSISHLEKSNAELEDYIRQESDRDCYEALIENKEVIRRMEERIELVKKEITEIRGLPLEEGEGKLNGESGAEDGQEPVTIDLTGEDNGAGEGTRQTQEIPNLGEMEGDAGLASEHGLRGAALRATEAQESQGQGQAQRRPAASQEQSNGATDVEEEGVYL